MSKTKNVQTLADFVYAVESICSKWDCLRETTHPWFRGQTNASWSLIPSLYRGRVDSYYERELLRDFRLQSSAYLQHPPANDLEWFFVMQHYGMPTRLLDWTESHLCALYFSLLDRSSSVDAAVWVLHPWSINNQAIGMYSVPTADHYLLESYTLASGQDRLGRKIKAAFPAAVRPTRISPRIIAQKGVFTIHGSSKEGLDVIAERLNKESDDSQIRLYKITIEGSRKKQLLKQLYLAGISESGLFPDLAGLCGEISYRYSTEHMKEITESGQVELTSAPSSGKKGSRKKSKGSKKRVTSAKTRVQR